MQLNQLTEIVKEVVKVARDEKERDEIVTEIVTQVLTAAMMKTGVYRYIFTNKEIPSLEGNVPVDLLWCRAYLKPLKSDAMGAYFEIAPATHKEDQINLVLNYDSGHVFVNVNADDVNESTRLAQDPTRDQVILYAKARGITLS